MTDLQAAVMVEQVDKDRAEKFRRGQGGKYDRDVSDMAEEFARHRIETLAARDVEKLAIRLAHHLIIGLLEKEGGGKFVDRLTRQDFDGIAQAALRPAIPAGERAEIPADIAAQVLSMGRVEWGATAALTDTGHLEHLAGSLRLTREHFNFEDVPVPMNGLYLEGGETVLCHTGTSPNSGPNAQALAGAWNWLHDQCLAALGASA